MSYQVALTFEDGVTRFIACNENETVADASYKARINIPLDCRDGACGTCKAFCESGSYDGGDYIEDALTDEEAEQGFCLPCQMLPESDLVLLIPATSDVAKTSASTYAGTIGSIERHGSGGSMVTFTVDVADPGERAKLAYLPGQYMNIAVPGSGGQTRSYSFSSAPDDGTLSFLVKLVDGGVMSTYLRDTAQIGDELALTGPYGSFFLRDLKRETLLLAGGSGLAPLLAMLRKLRNAGGAAVAAQPVHLILGINVDDDLVHDSDLDALAADMPGFTWEYVVADPSSRHANRGYVTSLMTAERMAQGDLDVYLCGPPPMVEAVRDHFKNSGVTPVSFYFEKFTTAASSAAAAGATDTSAIAPAAPEIAGKPGTFGTPATPGTPAAPGTPGVATPAPVVATQVYEIGEEHPSLLESDAIFDARMALELGVMELTLGRLSSGQLTGYRLVAENSDVGIDGDTFTDAVAFTEANALFHEYPFTFTGNEHLLQAFQRLGVKGHMAEALAHATYCHPDIVGEHFAIVEAFERGDKDLARQKIVQHAEHSKATMHRAMHESGLASGSVHG